MTRRPVLALIVVPLLLAAGCSSKDSYSIERKYYYLQREAGKIFNNLEASPPNELESVVGKFRQFSKEHANTRIGVDADFTVARLYLAKKEYAKCRSQLTQVMKKYRASKMVCSEALFMIGASYETEGRWQQALETYNRVIQAYPLTRKGMMAPVYIASYYKSKYQPERMLEAYRNAVEHYKGLSLKYPRSRLSFFTQLLVVDCYSAMKDWQNAVASLDGMIRMFKGRVPLERVYLAKALIYKNGMKDTAMARKTLEELVRDYPKSPAAKPAQEAIKALRTQ